MTAGYLALGLSKFKLNVDLQSVDYIRCDQILAHPLASE